MSTEKDIEAIIMNTRIFHGMSDTEGMIGFITDLRALDPGDNFTDEDQEIFQLLDPDTSLGAFVLNADRESRTHEDL